MRLRDVEGCVVNNVNLEVELENLIYFVNVQEKTRVESADNINNK